MYRLNIRDLYTVAVCFLVIIVLYIVAFGVTVQNVCIASTLASLLLAHSYWESGNEICLQVGLPPTDGHLDYLQSSGTNVVDPFLSSHSSGAPITSPPGSKHPEALSNDRVVCDSSSLGQPILRHNTMGNNDRTGIVPNATDSTSNGTVGLRFYHLSNQHICSQASISNPVQTTRGEHPNRSFARETAAASAFLGNDSQPQSAVGAIGYNPNSLIMSPNPQLPKSGFPAGSKNTTPELFPYAGQISRRTANEIVTHPTHQLQYGSLGVLPLVHLSEAPHTISNVYGHGPVADFRIAPPDPLIASAQFLQPDNIVPPAQISASCMAAALSAMTETRKRYTQHGEVVETGVTFQQQSNKRRRLDDSVESASSCSLPIGTSDSGGMNLKRPALADIRDEMGAPKRRHIEPSAASSSASCASQPGASARNPIDASLTSSTRWLKRKSQPDSNSRDNLNLSNCTTNKVQPLSQADVSMPLRRAAAVGQVQSTSYKVHVTNEDVEGDRHKEMERARYIMLGEDSDHIQDAELGLPAQSAVSSSAPLCPLLPQATTSGVQLSSGPLSVADSVSPAAELMSTCTAAPSVQEHTPAGTTVVYSTFSQADSAQLALRHNPTSSLGSSLDYLPVPSTANPNPPASFNFESNVSQSHNSTSAASSAILTGPPITTSASPEFSTGFNQAAGSSGGFRFDPFASSNTSSGFAANPTSQSNTVGGFKFVPSKKSMSAAGSLQFPQCVTTSDKIVSEITSTVSASANSAAVFGFGQVTGKPAAPSFSQPHTTVVTSTAGTSPTNADSSLIQVSTSIFANRGFAVQGPPVFTTDSRLMPEQSLAMNRISSTSFHGNIFRSGASEVFNIPSNTTTSFSGLFGGSVSSTSASMSGVEDRSNSALNSAAPSSSTNAVPLTKPFDGNPVTGMPLNSRGFFPSANTNNQSLAVNAFDSQSPNSGYETQQNSANKSGNRQNFGASTTPVLKFGAQPQLFGSFVNNQPLQPVSFGSQPAVTNSFSIQPTTAMAFNNQFTSMNPVISTPVASVNSLSNSNASPFSFTSQTSANFPSNSGASVFSFNNPTSTVRISKTSLPAFSFGNPTSTNSLSTSQTSFSNATSLNLFGSQPETGGQFANQGNNSASGFSNQQSTSSNSFNFGTPTTLANAFDGQTKSAWSFGKSSTDTNMFGNQGGDHATQTGGFGSYAGLSAPTCVVERNTLFSNPPQFTQAQFSFPSVYSGNQINPPAFGSTFQFPYNAATTSAVTTTQSPTATNSFSSGIGFSQFQSNAQTMNFAQFPTPSNPFSTAQSLFAPQTQWPPRFSIGTDGTDSTAKSRSLVKSKARKKS